MKTIQRVIEIDLNEVRSSKYDETVERIGEHSDTCFICGKRIKDLEKSKWVHYTTSGTIIPWDGADVDNSQGFFPVGNDCAKKLVIQFAFNQ